MAIEIHIQTESDWTTVGILQDDCSFACEGVLISNESGVLSRVEFGPKSIALFKRKNDRSEAKVRLFLDVGPATTAVKLAVAHGNCGGTAVFALVGGAGQVGSVSNHDISGDGQNRKELVLKLSR